MSTQLRGIMYTEEEILEAVRKALKAVAVTKVDGNYIAWTATEEIVKKPTNGVGKVHGKGYLVNGEALSSLMAKNELTTYELAELAGVSKSSVNRALNNAKMCMPVLKQLAQTLNISVSEIIKEEEK